MIFTISCKTAGLKILIFNLFIILSQSISAQSDSGYISCNLEFANLLMKLDTSNLSKDDYKIKYQEAVIKWNTNLQKYFAPNFKAVTSTNDTFDLARSDSKVVVLHFWTAGCAPCIEELPLMDEIFKSYKDTSMQFVSIATNNLLHLQKYNRSLMPLIPNATEIFATYSVIGYPLTIIIGKNKMIKYQFLGFDTNRSDEHKADIKAKIKEALKE